MREPTDRTVDAREAPHPAPNAPAEAAPLDDAYDAPGHRLRARLLWAPWCVALISLLPYEVIEGEPLFLWDLLGELPPAGLVACAAPLVWGLALRGVRVFVRAPMHLALAVLGAALSLVAILKLGADVSAWQMVGLPQSISGRLELPLFILALASAGASLSGRHPRGARALILIAASACLAFYLSAGAGERPLTLIGILVAELPHLPDLRFMLGHGLLILLLAWPLLIVLWAAVHLRYPAADDQPLVAIVALYGLPLMLALLVLRALPEGAPAWSLFTAAGGLLVWQGSVALLASTFEVLASRPELRVALLGPRLNGAQRALRRSVGLTFGGVVLLVGAQLLLAQPPPKGVFWTLGPPQERADALFAQRVPHWVHSLRGWQLTLAQGGSVEALLEVKNRGRALVEAARALDEALGAEVEAWVRLGQQKSPAGRHWSQAVERVNVQIRRLKLPYYLDPTVMMLRKGGRLQRWLDLHSFRVYAVHRYAQGGQAWSTLHVRRLDEPEERSGLLGFSRDHQPYALVDLQELQAFADLLLKISLTSPVLCDGGEAAQGRAARAGFERCGELLVSVLRAFEHPETQLLQALTRITDRHELQHQIDGPHLPLPAVLRRTLGGHLSPAAVQRINRELSAHLAQLSADGAPARLGLVHILPFALGSAGEQLQWIGMLSVVHLAHGALGRWEDDALSGAALAAQMPALIEQVAALDEATLRQRAKRAWQHLYGRPLPDFQAADGP